MSTDTAARTGTSEEKSDVDLHGIRPERALELMDAMLLYRRFEEKAEEAYAIGKIGGFCHLHIGQEAAAAGSILPLREDDYAISAYREHTQALAKGVPPRAVMAELFGRADGTSGGKGGSMHIFDAGRRFMGGHGIVGGQVPLAAGMGWSIRYRGGDQVVVCFMGDAAVNQGAFHEALNMSAVWDLPVIYVVENNAYGMGTAFHRVSRTGIDEKAAAYGIPTRVLNGQDVLETYAAFEEMAGTVRDGGGPLFVDLQTYRFKGHSMSDPVSGTYRSREEVEGKIESADPIRVLADRLREAGHLTQEALEAMDARAREAAQDAFDAADASPAPDPEALYRNVYSELNPDGRLFFDGLDRPDFAR
ncbi:MAG: pyruvate dehydrogenase (acetyl-transferring) E1 component subunit alpha [Longimicrobiales bacterium]|nr:pyruvate dehydrogenase (acetyl-transferring) E1 component subunit alpha [Longimicrobiales bacterium]